MAEIKTALSKTRSMIVAITDHTQMKNALQAWPENVEKLHKSLQLKLSTNSAAVQQDLEKRLASLTGMTKGLHSKISSQFQAQKKLIQSYRADIEKLRQDKSKIEKELENSVSESKYLEAAILKAKAQKKEAALNGEFEKEKEEKKDRAPDDSKRKAYYDSIAKHFSNVHNSSTIISGYKSQQRIESYSSNAFTPIMVTANCAMISAGVLYNKVLTELNLSGLAMGDDNLKILTGALTLNHEIKLKKLNISGNRLSNEGAKALADAIKINPALNITSLDIGCGVSNQLFTKLTNNCDDSGILAIVSACEAKNLKMEAFRTIGIQLHAAKERIKALLKKS